MTELLSPAGKSAEREAEKESWRTCMKMKLLQRVLINLAHMDLKHRKYVFVHLFVSFSLNSFVRCCF